MYHPASAFSGGLCAFLVDILNHPFDTLKTRLQSHKTSPLKQLIFSRTLLSGMTLNTISFPGFFMFFMIYDSSNFTLQKHFNINEVFCHFLSGSLGELASVIIRNPFEVAKQQMQVGLDKSVRSALKSIYKARGYKGN